MGFYSISMDDISEHFHIPIEQLKQKTYAQLETMEATMKQEKSKAAAILRTKDKNMFRIILEHFKPLSLMLRYWSFEDTTYHILMNTSRSDIVTEIPVPVENIESNNYYAKRYRLLDTRGAHIKQYTSKGEELADSKYCRCNIYEVPSQYQHLRHAEPIRELLLETFPQLKQFDISMYGIDCDIDNYQIYIKDGKTTWYVPFDALMRHDSNTIYDKTFNYAKSYNCGNIKPEIIENAAQSDEGRKFFEVIDNLPKIPIRTDDEVQALIAEKKGLYSDANSN